MSRSGYNDCDGTNWDFICWRGAVSSAIRGRRGQEFLIEMRNALDDMPIKRLIAEELEIHGEFCAIGLVGARRGVAMAKLDVDDVEGIASAFKISTALAREIEDINDSGYNETPEQRHSRVLAWVRRNIRAGK